MAAADTSSPGVPDDPALWTAMRGLLERLGEVAERDAFLDDCLDTVVDLLGADRGLIVLAHGDGSLEAVNARGRQRALTPFEREEVSRSIIRNAWRQVRSIVWEPLGDSDATASIADLGIVAAIAAPLRALGAATAVEEDARGVLYVDFRDARKIVGERHRQFVESAAVVVSVVLELRRKLATASDGLRQAQALGVEVGYAPTLEELLRPRSMQRLRQEIESCLHSEAPILIEGESGTGKTLLGRALAEASGRHPVVRAVLGSSDDLNTITSELFGHERGAFSGAVSRRTGLVEYADGGTLILDEILNVPTHAQQLLLDFTQFGTYRPLGHGRPDPKRARVRIIAATNGDLRSAVHERRFRQDLFFRLAGITLRVPPLRERREDIPLLAEGFLRRADPTREWTLDLGLRRRLTSESLPWPGNVRQLEGVIRRARERAIARDPDATVLTKAHVELEPEDLALGAIAAAHREPPPADGTLDDRWQRLQAERADLDAREARILEAALRKHGGVIAYAARELGLARTTLAGRAEALGVERPGRARPPAKNV